LGEQSTILQQDYRLLLDNKYSAPGNVDKSESEVIGPSRWRIDEAPQEQWVSVDSAIKYVTLLRDATRDPAIKANAEKTLAILGRYR
jgi:hypothetical protein